MIKSKHKNDSKSSKEIYDEDEEFEIPSKDEIRGHRNNKKDKRDYDKKDKKFDNWN